jgi:hypothetical protein
MKVDLGVTVGAGFDGYGEQRRWREHAHIRVARRIRPWFNPWFSGGMHAHTSVFEAEPQSASGAP